MRGLARHGHVLGLVALCAFAWYFSVHDMDLRIAVGGWSPIDWVYEEALPQNYEKNFPSGIAAYRFSAFMHVYPIAYGIFGIPPEAMMYFVVGLEIVLLAYGAWRLSRAILPESPELASMATVIVVMASHAEAIDLSRFGAAQFYGLYYAVANGLRLLAIAAALEGRMITAGALMAACAVTHPIEGLIGALFIAAMYAWRPREILRRDVLVGGLIFILVSVAWFSQLPRAGMSGGGIPADQWVALSRVFSYHWHPVDYGLFTVEHQERFIPFLGILLLLVFYFGAREWRDTDRKVAGGMAAMLVLTIAGILISWLAPVPFLIKLSLHRANLLFYLVAINYVVAGLWSELHPQPMWRCALALGLVISTFLLKPGFPLAMCIALTLPAWREAFRTRFRDVRHALIVAIAVVGVGLVCIYAAQGWVDERALEAYFGGRWVIGFTAMVWAMLATLRFFPHMGLSDQGVVNLGSLSAIGIAAVASLAYPGVREDSFPARDYKEAQVWARENTPPKSLFMVDPTIFYGWRDYSRRSSFGNLREWLYTTALYDSRRERFDDGWARFRLFGIPIDPYLTQMRPLVGAARLGDEVRKRFYASSCEWRREVASRYGVDFFVFRTDALPYRRCFPQAYRNRGFLIERVTP